MRGEMFRDMRVKALWVCDKDDDGEWKYTPASVPAALHLFPQAWEQALSKIKALIGDGSNKRDGEDLETPSAKRSQVSGKEAVEAAAVATAGIGGSSVRRNRTVGGGVKRGGDSGATPGGATVNTTQRGNGQSNRATTDATVALCVNIPEMVKVYKAAKATATAAMDVAAADVKYYGERIAELEWKHTMNSMSVEEKTKWMTMMRKMSADDVEAALANKE